MIEKLFQATSTIDTQPLKTIGSATENFITIGAGILSGIAVLVLIIAIIYQLSKNSGAGAQERKENNKKVVYGALALIFIISGWGIYGILKTTLPKTPPATNSSLLTTFTIYTPTLLNVALPVTNVALL